MKHVNSFKYCVNVQYIVLRNAEISQKFDWTGQSKSELKLTLYPGGMDVIP